MTQEEKDEFHLPLTIASLRKNINVTQEELAALLTVAFKLIGSSRKVTKKSVSDWETGRHKPRFTPEETLAACNVLSCTLPELAEASKNKFPPLILNVENQINLPSHKSRGG